MKITELETPVNAEKYFAPKTDDEYPFYITECGKTFRDTPCYQLRLNSNIACVQYVISGAGVIICNDRMYTVRGGDTFLLPEGSDQIYYSNPDNRFERIWLNFKGVLAQKLIDVYKLNDAVVFKNTDTFDILSRIYDKCRTMSDAEEYKKQTSCLFLELMQTLHAGRQTSCEMPNTVEKIRLYIDFHITENLKISEIADKFSYSEEHIIRVFKKTYGVTPHKYILHSKIRLAMIMLKTTDYSIAEIANRLNFSDAHHFSFQFRKIMGYKPSEYR